MSKSSFLKNECPKFMTKEWNELSDQKKKECKEKNKPANTTSFLIYNTLSMVIVPIVGGLSFALAILIIEPLQAYFTGLSIYWFVLIIFGIIMIITIMQFFIEKKKTYYKNQIE